MRASNRKQELSVSDACRAVSTQRRCGSPGHVLKVLRQFEREVAALASTARRTRQDSQTLRAEALILLATRLFLSGLILTVLFALGHLAGFLQTARAARRDPQLAELTRAMRGHKVNLLGFQPSLLDFREYFSLNFSVLQGIVICAVIIALFGLAWWTA